MCCGRRDVEKRGRKQMWHYPLSGMSWHLNVGPLLRLQPTYRGVRKGIFCRGKWCLVLEELKSIFISL